jgi:hypothetical protein
MPVPPISIRGFGGEVPAIDSRLIGDTTASDSVNAWLFSGRIEPIHSLSPLHIMSSPAMRSWFRLPKGDPGVDNMTDSWWLEFENENVRVIRSPVADQTDPRFYWCDGIYPKYTTAARIQSGLPPYKLGVPPPGVAPGVTSSGGVSTTNKTVSYAYTWVTGLGEEGPPSLPTTVVGKIDAIYHITVTAPTALQTANRDLQKTRIYRTVVSTQGVAVFYFVAEIPIATLTYDDDCSLYPDSKIVFNEQLGTITWSEPPTDLKGMVTMPNGMIAGWRANQVWFCEPYYPHSWPLVYVISVDAEIVGLGVHNQSLIILTAGQPYAATGVVPENMSLSKIQPLEPCTSTRSIVNTPDGVLYCSPNGLINITSQGAVNLTKDTILKSQWYEKLNLSSVMATNIMGLSYYCYSGPTEGVFQVDLTTPGSSHDCFQHDVFQTKSAFGTKPGLVVSLTDPRMGVTVLDPHPSEVFNLIQDLYNGETMQLRDGVVYFVDLRTQGPYGKYRWKSKLFQLPYLQNLGAAKVYWTPKDSHVTADAPTYFRVYAGSEANLTDDGLPLRFEEKMTQSGQMFRLPSGFKANYYQFEVEGFLIIDAIHCAQTARELRAI